MRLFKKVCLVASLAVLSASFSTPAAAKEVWKFGTAALPGTVLYDIVSKFIKDFNAVAGDEITIEYLNIPNEQEMYQQVVRGRIQMGGSSFAGGAITVPEGAVMNTPYLWKNDQERAWVTDNYALPVAKKLFAEKGLELVMVAGRRLERRDLYHGLPDAGKHQGPEDAGITLNGFPRVVQVARSERCTDAVVRVLSRFAKRSGARR